MNMKHEHGMSMKHEASNMKHEAYEAYGSMETWKHGNMKHEAYEA
jgi:hypothetical protein